jgi:hypothetical protein
MGVFSDLTEMSVPMTADTAIRWFQVIGAAGTMFALSAHAEDTFGPILHNPEFIDRFAAALAAIDLDESGHIHQADGGLGAVHFLGADDGSGPI